MTANPRPGKENAVERAELEMEPRAGGPGGPIPRDTGEGTAAILAATYLSQDKRVVAEARPEAIMYGESVRGASRNLRTCLRSRVSWCLGVRGE
jgi:hypothetical protein